MTFAELVQMWGGSPERLKRVLDELVASGDMAVLGQGRAKRYVLSR
jgi:hypothetical protein